MDHKSWTFDRDQLLIFWLCALRLNTEKGCERWAMPEWVWEEHFRRGWLSGASAGEYSHATRDGDDYSFTLSGKAISDLYATEMGLRLTFWE